MNERGVHDILEAHCQKLHTTSSRETSAGGLLLFHCMSYQRNFKLQRGTSAVPRSSSQICVQSHCRLELYRRKQKETLFE